MPNPPRPPPLAPRFLSPSLPGGPRRQKGLPWLEKPVSREELAAILIRLASTTDEVARDQTEGVGPR